MDAIQSQSDALAYFEACGYEPTDGITVCHKTDGGMAYEVCTVDQAPAIIAKHLDTDCYVLAGTLNRIPEKRGEAEDIGRIPALWADLDLKHGTTVDTIKAVITELEGMVGRASVVLFSGGGFQPRWAVEGDIDAEILGRWGVLVKRVCSAHGLHADSVYDLPRILRAPGSVNHKRKNGEYVYGEPKDTATKVRETAPIDVDRLVEVLDELDVQLPVRVADDSGERYQPMTEGRSSRYINSTIERIQGELKASAKWGEDFVDPRGRGWEKFQADQAYRLAGLALADWNDLTMEQARAAFIETAPTGGGWTKRDVIEKWDAQQVRAVPAKAPADQPDRYAGVMFDPKAMSFGSTMEDTVAVVADPVMDTAPSHDDTMADLLTEIRREELTHADQAALLVKEVFNGQWVWSKSLGWMEFDGKRWRERSREGVRAVTMQHFRSFIQAEFDATCKKFGGFPNLPDDELSRLNGLRKLLAKTYLDAVVDLAAGLVEILDPGKVFDMHHDLLNVSNGVIDLRTGKLMPHDAKYMMTKMSAVPYVEGAHTLDDFVRLQELMPYAEVMDWLQARFGQSITGYTPPDDLMIILMGGGSNGKTTFLELIRQCLGDYAATVDEKVLLGESGGHSTERMALFGARFALSEELPGGRELNMNKIKKLVGTSTLQARKMRQDEVTWSATHGLFLTTNNQPIVKDTDHGTWRRLTKVIFPIRYRHSYEELDGELDRYGDPSLKARAEAGDPELATAMLSWLVAGAKAWYDNGKLMPNVPDRVVADTKAWRMATDLILAFFDSTLEFDPSSSVLSTDLYEDFAAWCRAQGHDHPWTSSIFKARLMEHPAVIGHKLNARRTTVTGSVSRPRRLRSATLNGGQVSVIDGLRFKDAPDARPETPDQSRYGGVMFGPN